MATLDVLEVWVQIHHRLLPGIAPTDLGTLLCHSVRRVVALKCASALQSLGLLRLHRGPLFVMGGTVGILGHNLLIFSCRSQVAHGGDKVFHGFHRSVSLEVWLEALHRRHVVYVRLGGIFTLIEFVL